MITRFLTVKYILKKSNFIKSDCSVHHMNNNNNKKREEISLIFQQQ